VALALAAVTIGGALAVTAADMKAHPYPADKDVTVTLQNESGQWKEGKNSFVLEFTAAQDKKAGRRRQGFPEYDMGMPGWLPWSRARR